MRKVSWTDGVKNEVLHKAKERNILHTVKKKEG